MDQQLSKRLKSKTVKSAIINQMAEDFNLTPYWLKLTSTRLNLIFWNTLIQNYNLASFNTWHR